MLVNQPAILSGAFAAEGDKNTIPANNDGLSGLASIAKGFPPICQQPLAQGGLPPQRQDFNGIFNLFSQFLLFAQNGGVYEYNNTLDYQPPCIISYDGEFYSCVAENGPSTSAGVQAPTVVTYWEKVIVNSELLDILGNYAKKSDLNSKADIASPTFTGSPKAPTPGSSDNSTRIATTAFVQSALDAEIPAIATTEQLQSGTNNNTIVTPAGLTSARPLKTYTDWGQLGFTVTNGIDIKDVCDALPTNSMFVGIVWTGDTDKFTNLPVKEKGKIFIYKTGLESTLYFITESRQMYCGWSTTTFSEWVGTLPTGTILPFAGGTIPSGFLACNGAAVSRTTYSNLFSAIGTTYGSGNGSTTFNLPNLEDNRFMEFSGTRGTKNNAGLPNITGNSRGIVAGSVSIWIRPGSGAIATGDTYDEYQGYQSSGGGINRYGDGTIEFDASKSNSIYGGSTTVQPKSLTVRAIIKY